MYKAYGQIIRISHPTVIRSLVHLPEDYHLVLVGDGAERSNLESLIAELGLTERVHLLGMRTDVPNILKAIRGASGSGVGTDVESYRGKCCQPMRWMTCLINDPRNKSATGNAPSAREWRESPPKTL